MMQKLIDALDEAFELRREQCVKEDKTYDEVLQRWQGILNEAQNIKLIPNDTNVSFYTSDKLMPEETVCAKCGANVYWVDLGTRDITEEDVTIEKSDRQWLWYENKVTEKYMLGVWSKVPVTLHYDARSEKAEIRPVNSDYKLNLYEDLQEPLLIKVRDEI